MLLVWYLATAQMNLEVDYTSNNQRLLRLEIRFYGTAQAKPMFYGEPYHIRAGSCSGDRLTEILGVEIMNQRQL